MTDIVKDDGGPAFPLPDSDEYVREFGMSLRDWFAGHALAGISAKHGTVLGDDGEWIAMQAYAYADAMIHAQRALEMANDPLAQEAADEIERLRASLQAFVTFHSGHVLPPELVNAMLLAREALGDGLERSE